ncbi:MAG: outer membrane beta-barrel protein [Saprospiraceae bacterium]|nr:outer membrane beta-barrel protein [Saprospiraceae bacterium]
MKNIHFIIAFFCLSMATAYSQSGKLNISSGVGFEPTTLMDNATVNTLPMTLKLGYQVTPMFSLNAFGGYSSTTAEPTVINDGLAIQSTNKQTFLGLRGELKKGLGERFEVYGGGGLGYVFQDITEKTTTGRDYLQVKGEPTTNDPNAPNGRLMYAGFVGSTFFVQKHIGIYAELGYGVSLLNGGVTVRF